MNDKLSKEKLGKIIFTTSLILSVIIFLIVFVWSLTQPKDTDENVAYAARINYLVLFYVFTTLIPIGAIIREVLIFKYDKKKVLIKIGFLITIIIGGTLVFVLSKNTKIWQFSTIAAILLLTYVITPTVKDQKDEKV